MDRCERCRSSRRCQGDRRAHLRQSEACAHARFPCPRREVIREVAKEIIREVPRDVPVEVIREVPVEIVRTVIREVPTEVIKEVPIEIIKEVIVESQVEVGVTECGVRALLGC